MSASTASRLLMNRAAAATLILTLLSAATAWGYRIVAQPEDAYEFLLNEITLPRSVTGSVGFLECAVCVASSLRVTATTTYQLDRTQMTLSQFLEAAENILQTRGAAENTSVIVFFHVESLRVSRVRIEQIR